MRALCLTVLLSGCAAGAPAFEVQVGTGHQQFEAISDGEQVSIVCGAQGGQHIWTSVRARGVVSEDVDVRFTIKDAADGRVVCNQDLPDMLMQADGDWDGVIGITCFIMDPQAAASKPAVLEGTVDDHHGHVGSAQARLVPTWDGACHTGGLPPDAGTATDAGSP